MTHIKTNTEAESDLDAIVEAEATSEVGEATTAQPVPDATENTTINDDKRRPSHQRDSGVRMTRRYYPVADAGTTIVGGINATVTSITVANAASFPASTPFAVILEKGTANLEICLVTAVSGNLLTVTRGYNGTTALSHGAGVAITSGFIALDFDDAAAHIAATVNVHGVTGGFVGTTDVQTLSSKTLVSPAISDPTVTGTLVGANETLSGTLNVTGTTTLGAVNTGAVSASAVTASGAVTANGAGTGLAVTNNETVGGTLTVTGNATAANFTATGNGAVGGVLNPTSYANEAAAGTQAVGRVVYLTAPTNALSPGLFMSVGGGTWVPLPGSVLNTASSATPYTSSGTNGTTETPCTDRALTVNVVAGRNYFIEFGGKFVVSAADTEAVLSIHALQGAVAVGSPVIASAQQQVDFPAGAQQEQTFRQLWTPGASGAWNLLPGVKSGAGTGNSQITAGTQNAFLTVVAA